MTALARPAVERIQFIGNRVLMRGMKVALGVMPIRDPKLLVGTDAMAGLARTIREHGVGRVLVVTTAGIVKRNQVAGLLEALAAQRIEAVIYDGILPDPTFGIVREGLELLARESCDGIVAFGGGSAMDAAKVMAVAATNDRDPADLVGYFRGLRRPLPLFAVPTTAGTGSEATVASVISDDETHAKAFVVDSRTVPLAAALDPRLMEEIGPALTAATGMDALTHAIEAYISRNANGDTDRQAVEAIKLILEHLPRAYRDGSDLEAREAMAVASYKAGWAFTRALVGYVHAISHQLGAHYGIAHGLGNAIVLPHVLEFSRRSAQGRLASLAVATGLGRRGEGEAALARRFVAHIRGLNLELGIPECVVELQSADIPAIARGACREALVTYPVPRQMTTRQCEQLLGTLLAA